MKSKLNLKGSVLLTDDMGDGSFSDSRRSRLVRSVAAVLARKLGVGVELIHVEDVAAFAGVEPMMEGMIRTVVEARESRLKRLAGAIAVPVKTRFLEGRPSREIVNYSNSKKHSVIVVGTHGRTGMRRLILGSVCEEIVRTSRVPVLVVGPVAQRNKTAFFRNRNPHIVVGTDLGKNSRAAEEAAVLLAARLGGRVSLVHALLEGAHPVIRAAMGTPSNRAKLGSLIDELGTTAARKLKKRMESLAHKQVAIEGFIDAGNKTSAEVVAGAAQQANASVVIVGTHGRTPIGEAFFGSTTRTLIHEAHCPVLVVRS